MRSVMKQLMNDMCSTTQPAEMYIVWITCHSAHHTPSLTPPSSPTPKSLDVLLDPL